MSGKSQLPPFRRFITTHNEAGQATFSTDFPEMPNWHDVGGAERFLAHTTSDLPAKLDSDTDLKSYTHYRQHTPGFAVDGGTILCVVDFPPNYTSILHRTVTLDYGVVLHGSVTGILDSGETKQLSAGDIVVQRSTLHAWKNDDSNRWARMLFVLQSCGMLKHEGKDLGELFVVDESRPEKQIEA